MAHESNPSVKIKEENKRLLRKGSKSKGFCGSTNGLRLQGKTLSDYIFTIQHCIVQKTKITYTHT